MDSRKSRRVEPKKAKRKRVIDPPTFGGRAPTSEEVAGLPKSMDVNLMWNAECAPAPEPETEPGDAIEARDDAPSSTVSRLNERPPLETAGRSPSPSLSANVRDHYHQPSLSRWTST
ncbi:hypothetical protein RRG08_042194 [Elysia crispata]|uniref:Uncharacterized protein n=1 Tax=Elysia crispata TaxID=231223 RepID=A0AAE0YH43_9GAST|nr:hypothetical protein RRG08_042194 [Elysia crispata]